LLELQSATHSAAVCFCASRSLSIDVAALLVAIPDRSNSSITLYLMASSPRGNNGSDRCVLGLCFGRNGIRPRLQEAIVPGREFGSGRCCRALEKQPQFRMKPFATRCREGVKVQKSRHDPVSDIAASPS
jgi:hypothetical protein